MNLLVPEIEKSIAENKQKSLKEKGNSNKKHEEDEDDIYRKNWNDTPEIDINNYFSRTVSFRSNVLLVLFFSKYSLAFEFCSSTRDL